MNYARAITIAALQTFAILLVVLLLPVRIARKVLKPKHTVCLWTGTPIVTMTINASAERLLGYDAKSLVTHNYYITDAFDYNLSAWRRIPVVGYLVPFAAFVWACLFIDRVHLFCDRGLLPPFRRFSINFLELKAYRRLGIEVFLWTYGADVRSRAATLALSEPNCCTDCTMIGIACICNEATRIAYVGRLRQLANAIFSMGDMTEYTPGSINDLFFWPIQLNADGGRKYQPVFPRFDAPRPVRIVHAPNHRMFKGTRFLEQAVAALKSEGVPVELIFVEGVPNNEALEIYRSADIIFDQCLVGFHGYFALEGMALGKPVMCFIRKPAKYLLHPEECPIVNTHISTLQNDIRKLVNNREQLTSIGMQSRSYIEKYFSVEAFASRLQHAYQQLGVSK